MLARRSVLLTASVILFSLMPQAQTAPADICEALRTGSPSMPAPPSIKPGGEPVRVVAFGDFGDGSERQKRVADAMFAQHLEAAFDFGITLGDNFYPQRKFLIFPTGRINSPTHPRWDSHWEQYYSRFNRRFYAVLGNHDYDDHDHRAQLQRSAIQAQKSWCLPVTYYTYTAGPVQFFALDTNVGKLRDAQLDWLENALRNSRATWKVVYGHHPVKSDNSHGDDIYVREVMRKKMLPRLQRAGADVYLAGHDHDLEYLKPEGGVQLFISGGGGKNTRPAKRLNNSLWSRRANGFTVLEANSDTMTIRFFDADAASSPCTVSWRKGEQPSTNPCGVR